MAEELSTERGPASRPRRNPGADDSFFWAMSRQLRHDGSVRDPLCQAINLTTGIIDAAALATQELIGLASRFREKLIEGAEDVAFWEGLDITLDRLRGEMEKAVGKASFDGHNLLYRKEGAPAIFPVVLGQYDPDAGRLSIETLPLDLAKVAVIDENPNSGIMTNRYFGTDIAYPYRLLPPPGRPFLDATFPGGYSFRIGFRIAPERLALPPMLSGMVGVLDTILARLAASAVTLSTLRAELVAHQAATRQLMDVEPRNVARLVDADIREEGARMHALLARMRLGRQALHIANEQPKRIIDLFQDRLMH